MRFARGDVRGPHRFTQNRPRSFVAALQNVTAEEKSKNQLSRDFWCCPIFDFCNSIGTKRTCRPGLTMSVHRGAGSTGRRNTGVKSLRWGFKFQGLTRSVVELTSHFVQMGLRMHRQVGALRKVLSQQAIGVLVRSALPRALRIAKIDVDVGRQRKSTMSRQFLAPVPGQGPIQLLW